MKLLAAAMLLLVVSQPAQAGPKRLLQKTVRYVEKHERVFLAIGAEAGAFAFQYSATNYCQQGDFEHCNIGYGPRRTFDLISLGAGAVMIAASQKCHADDGPKPACYGLAYMIPATQTAFGVHDFLNYAPKTESSSKKRGD